MPRYPRKLTILVTSTSLTWCWRRASQRSIVLFDFGSSLLICARGVHVPARSGSLIGRGAGGDCERRSVLPASFQLPKVGLWIVSCHWAPADGGLAPRQSKSEKTCVRIVREEGLLECSVAVGELVSWWLYRWAERLPVVALSVP